MGNSENATLLVGKRSIPLLRKLVDQKKSSQNMTVNVWMWASNKNVYLGTMWWIFVPDSSEKVATKNNSRNGYSITIAINTDTEPHIVFRHPTVPSVHLPAFISPCMISPWEVSRGMCSPAAFVCPSPESFRILQCKSYLLRNILWQSQYIYGPGYHFPAQQPWIVFLS